VKTGLLKICLLLALGGLFGCAATSGGPPPTQTQVAPEIPDLPGALTLECNAAHRLGCRYKGRIFPWSAWVEAKGYNSKQYLVHDVIRSGNKAVVLVVER